MWTCNPSELIEADMSRLLISDGVTIDSLPLFAYESKIFPNNSKGIVCIIGSDHGGGSSKYLIRLNYLPSSARRKESRIDHGTRTLQFAEVKCKKDTHQIQAQIAPTVNESVTKLEQSKLIGIFFNDQNIICKIIPYLSVNMAIESTSTGTFLTYDHLNETKKLKLTTEVFQIPPLIWTVIPQFRIVISGDLSFFATATGRDGRSHCRCPYCDLSQSEWKKRNTKGKTMTLDYISHLADIHKSNSKTDTKGVIMPPQLNVQPSMYIVPLLHLMIGLVNKVWYSMLYFNDEFVETIGSVEASIKDQIEVLNEELQYIDEHIEIHTLNKIGASAEINTNTDALRMYVESCSLLKELKEKKKECNKILREAKSNLKAEREKRDGDEMSIEQIMYDILEESKIKKQYFHGGTLNGVSCRRLLDNVDPIFQKIKTKCHERLAQNTTRRKPIDAEKLDAVLGTFENVFNTLDVLFSLLRQPDPTNEEITKMEKGMRVLEQLWNDLELSYPPKYHVLLDHTIDQVRLFGGIADLVEDFIEKSHQLGHKLSHITSRMSSQCFRDIEMGKIRRKWLMTNPSVQKQIDKVKDATRRHRSSASPKKRFKKDVKREQKAIKRERCSKIIDATLLTSRQGQR